MMAGQITSRNRVNAISLTGLFATWLMEVAYVIFGGFLLFIISDNNLIREIVTCLKLYDYFLIPFVQVYTSAPIKRQMTSRNTN